MGIFKALVFSSMSDNCLTISLAENLSLDQILLLHLLLHRQLCPRFQLHLLSHECFLGLFIFAQIARSRQELDPFPVLCVGCDVEVRRREAAGLAPARQGPTYRSRLPV